MLANRLQIASESDELALDTGPVGSLLSSSNCTFFETRSFFPAAVH